MNPAEAVWHWISDGGVGTAATVATLVSTTVTLWFRFWERPEAEWIVTGSFALSIATEDHPERKVVVVGRLWNVGDGDAFRVRTRGLNCQARPDRDEPSDPTRQPLRLAERSAAVVRSGDSTPLVISVMRDEWDSASFDVTWTRPPTRHGRTRRQRFALSEIARTPSLEPRRSAVAVPAAMDHHGTASHDGLAGDEGEVKVVDSAGATRPPNLGLGTRVGEARDLGGGS